MPARFIVVQGRDGACPVFTGTPISVERNPIQDVARSGSNGRAQVAKNAADNVAEKVAGNAAEAVGRGGAFPKSARLLRHSDFDQVYRQGRRLFSANMSVFWLRREAIQPAEPDAPKPLKPGTTRSARCPRVGFTVGRVLGGSVVRNRIRRRLREAVRLNLEKLAAPVDVVINPRKSARAADFAQLLQEVAEAFRAIGQGRGAKATRRAD